MHIKVKKIDFSFGVPFLAAATIFLSGNLRLNYLYAVFFSSLHEAGHIAAMQCFGKIPKSITLGLTGIRIEKNDISLSYKQECIVALCGPAVNLVFLVIFGFIDFTGLPFAINAGLFIVNMLPVKTLDGGRFIYNFILSVADEKKAEKVLDLLEISTAFLLIAVLVISLVTEFVNSSFVLFTVFLVIAIVSEFIVSQRKRRD